MLDPPREDGARPAPCDAGESQIRVQPLWLDGRLFLELRAWYWLEGSWQPGERLTLRLDQLPALHEALRAAVDALVGEALPVAAAADRQNDRLGRLGRQLAAARERLEALRPEDYRRPQDYRRVRTLRLLDVRRSERLLRRAQGLREPEPVERQPEEE